MKNQHIIILFFVILLFVSATAVYSSGGKETGHTGETHEHDENAIPEIEEVLSLQGEKLKVVATTNILGDVISKIGGLSSNLTGITLNTTVSAVNLCCASSNQLCASSSVEYAPIGSFITPSTVFIIISNIKI